MCAGDAVKPSGKSFFTSRNYASTFCFPIVGHVFMMCGFVDNFREEKQ